MLLNPKANKKNVSSDLMYKKSNTAALKVSVPFTSSGRINNNITSINSNSNNNIIKLSTLNILNTKLYWIPMLWRITSPLRLGADNL